MADWKTYAKAARNTARKQAPGARDAAQRTTARATGYARAAGRALDEGLRDRDSEAAPGHDDARRDVPRPEDAPRDERREEAPRADERREDPSRPAVPDESPAPRPAASRPADDSRSGSRSVRDDAKIYAAVAGRTVQRAGKQAREAGVAGRIGRAVRDALLIGGSLLVIWGVLYAAGLPIPFTAVIIAVVIIVLIALAGGLYAQFARDRKSANEDREHDPREE